MTDREPDDLFDALRDRLADYGQEPPAPLWAGIRAQLPPPVAPPQLRPKRRHRAPVALLLFVLMMSGGLGWYWWQAQQPGSLAMEKPAPAAQYSSVARPNRTRPGQSAGQSAQHDADSGQKSIIPPANQVSNAENSNSGVRNPITKTENFASETEDYPSNAGSLSAETANDVSKAGEFNSSAGKSGSKVRNSIAKAGKSNAGPGNPIARNEKSNSKAAGFNSSPENSIARTGKPYSEAGNPNFSPKNSIANAGKSNSRAKNSISSAGKVVATLVKSKAKTREALVASRSTAVRQGPGKAAAALASAASGRALGQAKGMLGVASHPLTDQQSPARVAATTPAVAITKPPARPWTARLAAAASGQPGPAATSLGASGVAQPLLAPGSGEPAGQSGADALGYLTARRVALQMADGPARPTPQPVASTPPVPPAPFWPRWSVQVLAGPAFTYRQLSTPASATTATSSTPTLTNQGLLNRTTNVAALERPALGGGFQLSVRRAFAERWSLGLGLGYAEFATRLALQQVHGAPANLMARPDSSTTSIYRRDTYRFVTLPVRLGYDWALSNRWRVGVLAGAEAAFYMGGSSTEGSACACQSQTWGISGSPYRRVSLGASLGAEVRYRLNGRWELLAQPTATYLLTPLAKLTTAYYQRHLFGGTALLGAAYTLP